MKPTLKSIWANICLMHFPFSWSEARKCSTAIAFQLCCKICPSEGLSKPGRTAIEWDTSPCSLCPPNILMVKLSRMRWVGNVA